VRGPPDHEGDVDRVQPAVRNARKAFLVALAFLARARAIQQPNVRGGGQVSSAGPLCCGRAKNLPRRSGQEALQRGILYYI